MGDDTLWIAALTGGTAILASWVTSIGTTRAARIQAHGAAEAQRAERLRAGRREAYLELIEQTHQLGELLWEISAVSRNETGHRRTAALEALVPRERETYARLRRSARVVDLEGPAEAAAAAQAVRNATRPFHRALLAMIEGEEGAEGRFDAAYRPYWQALTAFVEAAQNALRET
ncbi:hypothetical protein [Streptomyces sp. ODS28]|uniref:hypothetical protein n=1 Tax=Streptomyces sp. ODS28 TaxID=3136688 RepID=UPI0031EBAA3B